MSEDNLATIRIRTCNPQIESSAVCLWTTLPPYLKSHIYRLHCLNLIVLCFQMAFPSNWTYGYCNKCRCHSWLCWTILCFGNDFSMNKLMLFRPVYTNVTHPVFLVDNICLRNCFYVLNITELQRLIESCACLSLNEIQ